MQPNSPSVIKQTIAAQIAALDTPINQLTAFFNCREIRAGSIMVSGTGPNGRDLHQLLAFNPAVLPVPVARLKQFFQDYCQDLIAARSLLIKQLEDLSQDKPPAGDQGEISPAPGDHRATRTAHCPNCSKVTLQEELVIKNTINDYWKCSECDFLI